MRITVVKTVTFIVLAGLALALAGLPVYVFPRQEQPSKADAIIVLGPPMTDRIELARRLQAEGYSRRIYVSVPDYALHSSMCLSGDVTCFHELPFTTRGEARFTKSEARKLGWSHVIVITGQFHVSRARYIFSRCVPAAEVRVIAAEETLGLGGWIYQYAYQTVGFMKAAVVGCAS